MSFPKYEAYKDSGVDWLGKVPKHWEVIKTSRLFKIAMGQTILKEDLQDDGEWPVFSATEGDDYFGRIDDPKVRLCEGDIVIPARGNSIGWVKLVREPATTSQTTIYCKKLQTKRLSSAFVYWFMRGLKPYLFFFTQTAIPQLTVEEVASNPLLLPPLQEQYAIAAFLDRETTKIDSLIQEQQRLIELLKEKRQAVISHAVTKGLNPDAPMKDSGVEWLGEVPEHWDMKSLWMMFSLGRGRVISHQDIANLPGPYPVYSSQTENEGEMGSIGTYDFEGDYLTWTTDGANAGTVFRRSGRFNCTNVCGTLKPKAPVNLHFLEALLSLATAYFVRHDINPKLMNNVMGKIKLPVPPLDEQTLIMENVDQVTNGFFEVMREAEATISLLQERRSALISAAVTGKIDVRGLVSVEAEAA